MSLQFRRRPAFARSRFPRFRRTRKLRWQAASVGTGLLTSDTTMRLILVGNQVIAGFNMSRPRVIRMRGEVLVDAADDVPGAGTFLYYGITVSNTADSVAGASYENPFSHSYTDDWLWWGAAYLESRPSTDVRAQVLSTYRIPLDVKSQRRFDPSDELVLICSNVPLSPPTPVTAGIVVSVRCLFAE